MSERDNSWDTLRAFLMLLGIPFHAALPYSVGANTVVLSDDPSLTAEIIGNLLHSFRMGAFFVIAGYFSALAIDRKGASAWWAARWRNLLIPLVVSVICFIPLLLLIRALDMAEGGPQTDDIFAVLLQVPGEHWTGHLWFLIVLLELCLITALAWRFLRPRLVALGDQLAGQPLLLLAVFIVPVVLVPRIILSLTPFDDGAIGTVLNIRRLAEYTPYFVLGLGLTLSPSLLAQFSLLRPSVGLAAMACCLAYAGFDYLGLPTPAIAAKAAAGVLMCSLLLGVARRFFAGPRPAIRWLVQAAFTIYLFHFPIVVIGAYWFEAGNLPSELRFVLIVLATLAVSCLVHLMVSRSNLLLLLFNGRPMRAVSTRIEAKTA